VPALNTLWRLLSLAALVALPVRAQDPQFLPEVDAHLKINSSLQAYVQAKDDRDAGASDQFSIGPSLQLYLRPLLKLKRLTKWDLDDAKSRFLVLELGYRYLVAPDAPPDNRMIPMVTFNLPINAGLRLSDRSRADLDWKGGQFLWRYRNRLSLERTFKINSYHLIPFVAAEPYYVSQYRKWSTTALFAGSLFPAGKHAEFNIYYEHENNTGKRPNQSVNQLGLALYVYFSLAHN
jgi:hypothetical protein